ncbi:MAG: hypothetical protein LQ342_002420 [Letrouitia transgressa]|nr:MAG: hypothetical protein LQ342_002420 [Letrouitia transgressa]
MTSPLGSTADCFSGWANYPINIANQDDLIPSAASLNDRLTRLTKTLFSSTVDLHLIGIKSDGSITADTKHYDQETDVETAIRQDVPSPPRIRIVSLHSKKTPWEPKVTQRLMRKILTVYKVDPAFLHVLFSFGAVPHLAESGSSNLATSTTSDGSQNISYQFRYVEENHRSEIQPWSIRQTGIYHHHSASENFDFFIVLNPYPLDECAFGGQLLDLTRSHVAIESLLRHPYRLHALAFAAYLDNWRWYFRHLGEKFSKMVRVFVTTKRGSLTLFQNNRIMTLNLEPNIVGLTFDEVQGLRNLEDTALSLGGYCKSALSIVQRLQSIPETKFEQEWTLQPYSDRLGDFVESLSTLAARINNTIDLVRHANSRSVGGVVDRA